MSQEQNNYAELIARGKKIPSEESAKDLQTAFKRVQYAITMNMLENLRVTMRRNLLEYKIMNRRRAFVTYSPSELWSLFAHRKNLIVKAYKIWCFLFGSLYRERKLEYNMLREIRDVMYKYLRTHGVYLFPVERHKYNPGELWGIAFDVFVRQSYSKQR